MHRYSTTMSTVIKAGQSGPVLKRLSTVDLADHLAEAHAVVGAARRRAERIVTDARTHADGVLAEANRGGYETGYAAGRKQGIEDGYKAAFDEAIARFDRQHADVVADMGRAISEIDRMKEDLRIAAERDVLEFAVALAAKLTVAVGRMNREAATENLRRALRLVGTKTDLAIRVHPTDAESMETFAASMLRDAQRSPAVSVESDEAVTPGGCVVRAGRTVIDATLDTQISEMIALLL